MMYQYGWGLFVYGLTESKTTLNQIRLSTDLQRIFASLYKQIVIAIHDFWNIRYAWGIMHMPLLFKDISFEDRSDPFHGCPTDDVTITPVRVEHPWMIEMSKIDVYTIKTMKHSAT